MTLRTARGRRPEAGLLERRGPLSEAALSVDLFFSRSLAPRALSTVDQGRSTCVCLFCAVTCGALVGGSDRPRFFSQACARWSPFLVFLRRSQPWLSSVCVCVCVAVPCAYAC